MKNLLLFLSIITLVVMCKANDDDDDDCRECPKGEKYEECGPCNQPDCDDRHPDNDGKHCKGCFCPKGYIRKNKGGPCIPEKDCHKCPKGEIYEECGPCNQPDCDDRHPDNDGKHCKGCFCPKGYIRKDKGGPCIPEDDCPKCPKGEIYETCGPPVQPDCDYRYPDCNKNCTVGCFCPKGEIRQNKTGPCIEKKDCPDSPCNGDPNAVWVKDPNVCPPTCQHRKQPEECHKDCDHYGCECKKGFILDEISHKCVDPDDCPCGCHDDDN